MNFRVKSPRRGRLLHCAVQLEIRFQRVAQMNRRRTLHRDRGHSGVLAFLPIRRDTDIHVISIGRNLGVVLDDTDVVIEHFFTSLSVTMPPQA